MSCARVRAARASDSANANSTGLSVASIANRLAILVLAEADYNHSMIEEAVLTALSLRLAPALAPPRANYRPLRVEGREAGWLNDRRAARLARIRDVFTVDEHDVRFVDRLNDERSRSEAIERVARELAAAGDLTAWRDERYAVAPTLGAAPWFLLERSAARYFGIQTHAVHVNGVVRDGDSVRMWIARRSPTKSIDPGMLDNLVGGGIAAGQTIATTLVKEAWEEAGVPAALASRAQAAGIVQICREQSDGLQRETIFIHDLWLPSDFAPAGKDDEVVEHRLVTLPEAARLIAEYRGPDVVTVDASVVILDFLMRHGQIEADTSAYGILDAFRHPRIPLAPPPV